MWDYRFEPSQKSGKIGLVIVAIGILLTVISVCVASYQTSTGDKSFNIWIPTIIFAVVTIIGVFKIIMAVEDQKLIMDNELYLKFLHYLEPTNKK